MVLTGRAALVALLCVVPIALAPDPAVVFVVLFAALAVAVVVDIALAVSPAGWTSPGPGTRSAARSVGRLGTERAPPRQAAVPRPAARRLAAECARRAPHPRGGISCGTTDHTDHHTAADTAR